MRKILPIIIILAALALGAYLGFVRGSRKPVAMGPAIWVSFLTFDLGNATLVRTPEGEAALIDPGPASTSGALADYLNQERVHKLTLVLTSPSAEKAGALGYLLGRTRVVRIILGTTANQSRAISRDLDRARQMGVTQVQVAQGTASGSPKPSGSIF